MHNISNTIRVLIITAAVLNAITAHAEETNKSSELCQLVCHVEELIKGVQQMEASSKELLHAEYSGQSDSYRALSQVVLKGRIGALTESFAVDITDTMIDNTLAVKRKKDALHLSAGYFTAEYRSFGDQVLLYMDAALAAEEAYITILQDDKHAYEVAIRELKEIKKALCALENANRNPDARELIGFFGSEEFKATMTSIITNIKGISASLEARRERSTSARNANRQAMMQNIATAVDQVHGLGANPSREAIMRIILGTFYGVPFPQKPIFP